MLHSNDFMLKPTNYIEKNVMQYLTLSKLGAHTHVHTHTMCRPSCLSQQIFRKKKIHAPKTHTAHPHTCRPLCLSQQIL